MENDLNNSPNEKTFMKMFETQKDNDEKLYKNTLFGLSDEIKGKKDCNIKELTHDSLLKRMSMEDYSLFPPKNDSLLITDDENLIGKEDPEKLYEEEVNYLRSINQINYLTFSPFGDSFFPYKFNNKNQIINNNDNEKEKDKDIDNSFEEKLSDVNDRENKILNIIDFDYNNYEINNDLLFNISLGFIDMNKLKHENVVSSDVFVPRSERFNNGRKLVNKFVRKITEDNRSIFESNFDVEFKSDLLENILKFVNKNENNEFFSKTINNFYKEYTQFENMNKNMEKNKLLLKWDKIFKERQKMYKYYLIELEKKERQKRKQLKIQKEIDEKIYQEKLKQFKKEKEFENELEKIRIKGLKELRRNSLMNPKKNIHFSVNSFSDFSDIFDVSISKNKRDSNYSCSFERGNRKRRHGRTVYQRRRVSGDERIEWLKAKNDYVFFHL